jgi:hypothetical protein
MLLAARALGLGATLTTLYLQFEKEAEAALGLPAGVHSYALLPMGYPMGRFGPVRRVALADIVFGDQWASLAGIRSDGIVCRNPAPWRHFPCRRVNSVYLNSSMTLFPREVMPHFR